MGFYSHYRGRSVGRIIHFLHYYCGHAIAEHCQIGEVVTFGGKTLTTIEWDSGFGLGDVPVFNFAPHNQTFAYRQRTRRARAISDGCRLKVWEDGREPVSGAAVRILVPKEWSQLDLYSQSAHGARPTFFTRKDSDGPRLFAEADGWIYAWDKECGWLLWVEVKKAVDKAAE